MFSLAHNTATQHSYPHNYFDNFHTQSQAFLCFEIYLEPMTPFITQSVVCLMYSTGLAYPWHNNSNQCWHFFDIFIGQITVYTWFALSGGFVVLTRNWMQELCQLMIAIVSSSDSHLPLTTGAWLWNCNWKTQAHILKWQAIKLWAGGHW